MSGISFKKGLWSSIILMMFLVIPSVIRAEEKKTDETTPPLQRVNKSLSAEDQAQGWLLLFDGKTFFGWEARPLIQLRPLAVPDPKIKMTRGEMSITTEIPIQVRTPLAFPSDWEIEFTYRTEGDFVGLFEIYRPDRTGSGVKSHAYAIPIAPSAESRTFTATPDPSDGSLLIDGIHVTKLSRTADRPGLSLAIEKGKIDIDSVRVRIPGASVASGTDLEGWRLGGESKAEVTPEGAIHLTGGSGYLESEEEIADGFIRLEFQEKASPNNSGLFFRTIPGSAMDGYECQMNNNPPDGDREKFLGNDTGSVFRRAAARRVVADPSEWTGLTVMMDGNLFRTWVNGIPTLLWTDTRSPEENPRKGLRLAPGTIQIQGMTRGRPPPS